MEKRFQRKKEDFVCKHCGITVKGSGYTDHCPECLWSRHVDIYPGDRRAECKGMMEPMGAKDNIIYYQCIKCGFKHRVKTIPQDNFESLLKLFSMFNAEFSYLKSSKAVKRCRKS